MIGFIDKENSMNYKMLCILALLISGIGIYASQQSGPNDPTKGERVSATTIVTIRNHGLDAKQDRDSWLVRCCSAIRHLMDFQMEAMNGFVDRYRFSQRNPNQEQGKPDRQDKQRME